MARRKLIRYTAVLAAVVVSATGVGDAAAQSVDDNYVKAGDALIFILPAGALATTLVAKDRQGSKQFLIGGSITMATVVAVKYVANVQRPDESTYDSFPSGHTTAAFYGAGFIHRRYGWKYAAWVYPLAMYVGYSRIHANRHWADDVFAGAFVSLVANWWFTKPYSKKVKLNPDVSGDRYGLSLEMSF